MINADQFAQAFEPALAAGDDLIYIGMSSGISGTVQAATVAANALAEKYPQRKIYVKDTLGASFGEGLFVKKASEMRAEGRSVDEAAAWIDENVQRMNQVFTVEDLMFLRRGGRLSGMTAVIGTLANVKPILWGNEEGKIVAIDKMIGRKRSLRALAERFAKQVVDPESQTIAIAHSDCEADAQYLLDLIRKQFPESGSDRPLLRAGHGLARRPRRGRAVLLWKGEMKKGGRGSKLPRQVPRLKFSI